MGLQKAISVGLEQGQIRRWRRCNGIAVPAWQGCSRPNYSYSGFRPKVRVTVSAAAPSQPQLSNLSP